MTDMIIALVLTIITELLILILLKKENKILILSIFLNIITNLSLNLILQLFLDSKLIVYIITLFILEVLILIIEALGYNIIIKNLKSSFYLSLTLNAISFITGLLILNIF